MQLPHDYGATGGIASRLRRPIHGGQVEAINSTIKVITRMAHGGRDGDESLREEHDCVPR